MSNTDYKRASMDTLLKVIDNKDWDSLSSLLAEDTSYEVSGFAPMQGRRAVMDYYAHARPIQSGTHSIESFYEMEDAAVSCGVFTGVRKDGERISIRFADEIEFENFKIKRRRVYFCQLQQ